MIQHHSLFGPERPFHKRKRDDIHIVTFIFIFKDYQFNLHHILADLEQLLALMCSRQTHKYQYTTKMDDNIYLTSKDGFQLTPKSRPFLIFRTKNYTNL